MCRQRWGEHPAAEGLAKPPSCTQPCFCLLFVAHLNGRHCRGTLCPFDRTLLLLMGSLGLFSITQTTLCLHLRGMPVSITPATPAPIFPGLLVQSLKKDHVCDCLHPSPASPLLPGKHSPFPAARDVFFFIAIVTMCKYLGLMGF